ncbi:hypothetical protein HN011_004673 [Eciton burchellii]|nr:hypothetical protein HN011_004673 [Eciton burchellii]
MDANHAIIDTFAIILDFFIRNEKRKGYCLVCDTTIEICQYKNIRRYLCMHIRSKKHIQLLSMMVEDEKKSVNGKFFNKLTLAREYIMMIIDNDEFVKCLLCKSKNLSCEITKNEESLHKHITSKAHKDAKISWELPIQNALQSIHDHFQGQYNAEKHYCEFCHYQSPSEMCFMKHLRVPYHVTRLMGILDYANKYKFYFCNVCMILWFGNVDTSTSHHEHIVHKQSIKFDSLMDNIPKRLIQFLEMSESNVEILLNYSDDIHNDEAMKNFVIGSFESYLRKYIPNIKAYPFGSRISGLGTPKSDIDIFLDCNYTYEGKTSFRHQSQNLITLVVQYLFHNKKLWNVQCVILNSRTPIAKVLHIPSKLICDISVSNGLAVENTKMIKCFNFAFPPCRKLILFLKEWLYLSGLSGSHIMKNYALAWCVIFYFQILLVFPCISELIKFKNKSWLISGWEVGVSHNINVNTLNYSFEEFLLGFFLFYANFEYKQKIICPLLGRPIQKDLLNNLSDLPQDMAPYVAYMQNRNGMQEAPQPFAISPLCVQDPFDLSHNLTKAINNKQLKLFQNNCVVSAKILKIISPNLKPPFMPY